MDNIHYNFIDVKIPDFDPEFFDLWLSGLIGFYQLDLKELTYVFCSDEELLRMNKEYLEHDYFTDVITFDYNEKDSLWGDVFVSYDRVVENANSYGNSNVFDELCRVVAHGLLHLAGYNDKEEKDKAVMKVQEEVCLSKRSFT